jgi:phosphoglycerate dehydrogenase-like enzyme
MTSGRRPRVLLDPHPRTAEMIFHPEVRRRLDSLVDVVEADVSPLPDAFVDAALPDVVAIIGQTPLSAERIARAARLVAVLNVEGNLLQNIDYGACFVRGIRVLCASPAFARPVAEYGLALALDLCRGVSAGDRRFRRGEESYGWRGNVGIEGLYEATVGMIGFGAIARALVPLLAPFRCRISAFDPWLPDESIRECGAASASLDSLLRGSDVIFMLAAATTSNRAMLGAPQFALMRDGAKLVLLSRADVVDFGALVASLHAGRLQAAIDVFPEEPLAADHPLRRSESALLSSHRAGGIDSALKAIGAMAVDDLALMLRGLPPVRMASAQPETVGLQRSRPGIGATGESSTCVSA